MVDRLRSFWCPFLERLGLGKEEGKVKGEREGPWGVKTLAEKNMHAVLVFFGCTVKLMKATERD